MIDPDDHPWPPPLPSAEEDEDLTAPDGPHTEVEARLDEAVQGLEDRLELIAVATRNAIEATQARTVEAVRSELALFGMAVSQRDDADALAPDPLSGLGAELRAAIEQAVEDTAAAVRLDLAVVRAAVVAAVGEEKEREEGHQAMLRTEVRRVLDRATSDTLAAVRADIASLQSALRAAAAESRTTEAEALTQLRAEARTALEHAIHDTVDGLRAEVAAVTSSLGSLEQVTSASAAGVAALRAERDAHHLALQQSIGEALIEEARAREQSQAEARTELQDAVRSLESMLEVGLTTAADVTREQRDASAQARERLHASMQAFEVALTTRVDAAAGAQRGQAEALRTTLDAGVVELQRALAAVASERADERAALREELVGGLGAVTQLIVDLARTEAEGRAEAIAVTQRQIGELATAMAELIKMHIGLRDQLTEGLGL